MSDVTQYSSGAALRWVELAELVRSLEVATLQAKVLLRGVDAEIPSGAAVTLLAEDAGEVLNLCDEIGDAVDQLRMLAEPLQTEEIEIRWLDLQAQAAAALAAGVADVRRVALLARSLSVRAGFRALAEALRCTDCHEAWDETSLADVLGSFRDADAYFVRRLTAQALLSPETRFDRCDREQIARLAAVLEEHAGTARCR